MLRRKESAVNNRKKRDLRGANGDSRKAPPCLADELELLHIRNDGLPFEEVKRRALELDERFQAAFERTTLPEQPDYAQIDAFLIRARRRMVDA
jgi:hypothetical protein